MHRDEYIQYDGLGLAELVRKKDVSALELLETAIAQVDASNKEINAVVHTMYDEARHTIDAGLAEGPFTGVPFLLKDLGLYYKGVPTSSGSRLFRDYLPDHDSNLTKRYKDAGLVIFGKTNTPEFGLVTTTEPVLWGATKNPWNKGYSSGGSSGGAGAAVAAGYIPLANASDGGGSIRIPASATGLLGLKPTRARTPMGPDQGEGWNGSSTIHAVTRSVRDCAALLDATAGEDSGAPYAAPHQAISFLDQMNEPLKPLRIGVCTKAFNHAPVDEQNVSATFAAARLCESLGHHVEEAIPAVDGPLLGRAHTTIVFASIAALINQKSESLGREVTRAELENVTFNNWLQGNRISAPDYVQAVQTIHRISRDFAGFFSNYDLLLTPTMACTTPKLGELNMESDDLENYGQLIAKTIGFTALFNSTGCPAISVPLAQDKQGMPLGIQFGAAFGGEGLLLQLARQLEEAKPWFNNLPSVVV